MSASHDPAIDPHVARLLALDTMWDDTDTEPPADAVVAAIAAERRAPIDLPAQPSNTARRWWGPIAAGVAAATLTLVVAGVWTAGDDGDSDAAADLVVTMSATDLAPAARATASVTARPLGTVIRLDAAGLPPAEPGTYYEAFMHRGTTAVSAGTFHMRGGDGAVYLWSGVDAADFPVLTVTVQTEGEPTPSDQLVLRADLD